MLRPLTGEVRARHAYLEAAQASLAESFDDPIIVEYLGESDCAELLDLSQKLAMPNIKGSSRLTLPKTHDEEAIPYIAAKPGEEFMLDPQLAGPTPSQRQRMYEAVVDRGDPNALLGQMAVTEAIAEMTREPLPEYVAGDNFGFVYYDRVSAEHISPNNEILWRGLFKGRPHLGLVMNKSIPQISLMHELEHVRQTLSKPVILGSDEVRIHNDMKGELYAYHYAARLAFALRERGIVDFGEEKFSDLVIVEALRSNLASDEDPFNPSDELLEALRSLDIENRVRHAGTP
jgi:hypothetical protein